MRVPAAECEVLAKARAEVDRGLMRTASEQLDEFVASAAGQGAALWRLHAHGLGKARVSSRVDGVRVQLEGIGNVVDEVAPLVAHLGAVVPRGRGVAAPALSESILVGGIELHRVARTEGKLAQTEHARPGHQRDADLLSGGTRPPVKTESRRETSVAPQPQKVRANVEPSVLQEGVSAAAERRRLRAAGVGHRRVVDSHRRGHGGILDEAPGDETVVLQLAVQRDHAGIDARRGIIFVVGE